jgi:hypothetical protein
LTSCLVAIHYKDALSPDITCEVNQPYNQLHHQDNVKTNVGVLLKNAAFLRGGLDENVGSDIYHSNYN